MGIYEKVTQICEERHIKMREVERQTHMGHATIAKWKDHSPTIKNVRKIADYLGVDICELIGDEDG